ncbi:unnamed protein product [Mytilus edulis]|uniref:B box-type domain-containing protein n=1 Tax=Mytilus edulis TaxID=6550 RepID=A0A8S3U177_MYTED|nr:unnamed protein product [Mytilus edulis]
MTRRTWKKSVGIIATETQEIICGPCDFREIAKLAVVWCPTCDEGLCDECSGHHNALKATRSHQLIDRHHYKEMPRKLIEELNKCFEHDEKFELYCPNHEIHCCVQCVKEKHAHCTGVTLLNKVIENIKSSAMVSTVTQQLGQRLEGLLKLIKNRKENIDRIEKQSSKLCIDFGRMRKEMDLVLDEFENALNKQATSVKNSQSSIEMHSDLQKVIAHGSNFQVYSAVKKIEQKIKNEDKEIELFSKTNSDLQEINVVFECSEHLSSLLSKSVPVGTINTLQSPLECELKIHDNLEAQILSPTGDTDVSELCLWMEIAKTEKAKLVSYNQHTYFDISIVSIVPLPSGQIVITDYGGYQGILLFTSEGEFNTCFTNLGTPYGACLISNSVLAVSFPQKENIKLLEIEGSVCQLKTTLRINQECFGLSVHSSDGNIIAATRSPDKGFIIIDLDGKILQRVNLSLPKIAYVQCHRNQVIVTELSSNEVLMYDLNGKKIRAYTFDGEPDTRNVCVDKHGNIFVSAFGTGKVTVILNKDGRRLDVLGPENRLQFRRQLLRRFCATAFVRT